MKRMLLIDGNSMLFRAYYATAYGRVMRTSNGLATNAVYGFNMMIDKAIQLVEPDAILVAFDAGKQTFRHELYADYKGGRRETPEDLKVQFPIVRELIDSMGIRYYEEPGMEADDIIGSTARKYNDTYHINILTSDHDMLQLIDTNTSVWLMKKGLTEIEEMSVESLKEQMGIAPLQIIDLKGLMGDASDNIPGIAGIGEKTALKLLAEYGSVENLLDHTEELKGKLKEKVEAGHDSAILSKRLATIATDMDIHMSDADMQRHYEPKKLYDFYKKYEMKSLMNKVDLNEDASAPVDSFEKAAETEGAYETVTEVPAELLSSDVALYADYDFDDAAAANLYGFALSKDGKTVYIALDDALAQAAFVSWLKEENHKIVYDAKWIYHLLDKKNLTVSKDTEDVKIMAFLIDNYVNDFDKFKEKYEWNLLKKKEEIYGKVNKPLEAEKDAQAAYSCTLANKILTIYPRLKEELAELEMTQLYEEIERPLIEVLYDMEKAGISVNETLLNEIAEKTLEKIEDLKSNIYFYAMKEFNINSTQQLAQVLFDDLGLPANKKRSTAVDVLERLRGKHPIIDELIEYRKYSKLYSTYAEGLKKYIQEDGKIHTTFDQCGTQTGRLSSNDPNLQNISVRTEEGREIRKAFVPEENSVLVSCDYSQVELRMLAHMAKEPALIEAFNEGMDIHTKTAMDIFHVAKDDVTSLMRRQAKAINFGIVYGMSGFGLAEQIGVSNAEANAFIDKYFASYPKIQSFMDETVEHARENGYVTTLYHRRRYIPELNDKNYMIREFGKRAAMNAPIQGSAADLIKIAMIRIYRRLLKENYQSRIILQIHDEVLLNVPKDELEAVSALIEEEMSNAMHLSVPLVSNLVFGETWYEAK